MTDGIKLLRTFLSGWGEADTFWLQMCSFCVDIMATKPSQLLMKLLILLGQHSPHMHCVGQ